MPAVLHEDATIWFEERGEGAPVILAHGGLFDPMDADRFWITPGVASDLANAGYQVLAPDRRYHGRTTAPFAAHSWTIDADDLAAVIWARAASPVYLIAGSNGCSAAVRLVLDHPLLVRGLILCWPPDPESGALREAFERAAVAMAARGPERYLADLREHGVPRPNEDRAGFPFGFALLRDPAAAASFLAMSGTEAAEVFRQTARALLTAGPLRGISAADAAALGTGGMPITVVPAAPDDPYHPRAAAVALAAIPGAKLREGFPTSPSPCFPGRRADFIQCLRDIMAGGSAR